MSARNADIGVKPARIRDRSFSRERMGTAVSQVPAYLLLSILSLSATVPFIYLVLAAFKPYKELINPFPKLFPQHWSVATFVEILTRRGFVSAMWNTFWTSTAITLIQAVTAAAGGYVFAKYTFPGKELLFKIILATMMVPFAALLVPLYITMVRIHLVDNLLALPAVAVCNTFSIFVMRQFMESIPRELIEAARIDGAGEVRIFGQIVIPMSLAPLTTVSVFAFLAQWDNFMFPTVIINDMKKQTLPLFLNGLRSIYWTRYDLWITGALLTILPVLTAYFFTQKTFVRGAQTSGLKG